MRMFGALLSGLILCASSTMASADTVENLYLGFSVSSLALDNDRVAGVPTRSPSHTPKIGSLFVGFQFNENWAADISFGTDISSDVDTDQISINGYRFFGDKNWKPYISAGLSSFNIDDAIDDKTEQAQLGFGVSGTLSDNLELRIGYQHFIELGGESYDDDGVSVALNWHFKKPKSTSSPAPQPESVPKQKEVIDTFELLVEFDFDKSKIKSAYRPQFNKIVRILKESPEITITIEGHTDSVGSEKYNQKLSERRSGAVKKVLLDEYGLSPDRIKFEGYGETRPVADNNTPAGRQKNRRAIAVILRPRMVTE